MINLSKLIFILIILHFPFHSLHCLVDIDSYEVNCTWLFASLIISLKMDIYILFNIPYIQHICNIYTVCTYICIYICTCTYIYIFFFPNQNFVGPSTFHLIGYIFYFKLGKVWEVSNHTENRVEESQCTKITAQQM